MIGLPQSRHLRDHMAVDFLNATLQAREQNVSVRSDLKCARVNSFPQNAHLCVKHFLQTRWCGEGEGIMSPHLSQTRGGTIGYGRRLVLNRSGCSAQNLLSALAWHTLQSVARLLIAWASRRFLNRRYGTIWWASSASRSLTMPHSWQVKLSRSNTARDTRFQAFPRFGLLLSIC